VPQDNDSIRNVQAVDVHAHYGPYSNSPSDLINTFMTANAEFVARCAEQANTRYMVVSPMAAFMPRGDKNDTVAANEDAVQVVECTERFLQWVVIDPRKEQTYKQAQRMLALPKCVGIKIHPEEHVYPIVEHGRTVFEFAAAHKAVVLAHSGEFNSLPADMVKLANDYPEMSLILAHLGNGEGDPSRQVRAIQGSRHGNVYADTSSGMSMLPNLIEWAVGEVGADRILYGSDVSCYFPPMQRARIDHAHIRDDEKLKILRDNAVTLLGLNMDDFGSR
jgi:predicted TIM-barrel fold metal-dependent hydrolase